MTTENAKTAYEFLQARMFEFSADSYYDGIDEDYCLFDIVNAAREANYTEEQIAKLDVIAMLREIAASAPTAVAFRNCQRFMFEFVLSITEFDQSQSSNDVRGESVFETVKPRGAAR